MLGREGPVIPPPTTMLGALYRYLREADPAHFQPMNANFGLVDDLPARVKDKRIKREKIAERALSEMAAFAASLESDSPQRAQRDAEENQKPRSMVSSAFSASSAVK